jgi:hypothetical protein
MASDFQFKDSHHYEEDVPQWMEYIQTFAPAYES